MTIFGASRQNTSTAAIPAITGSSLSAYSPVPSKRDTSHCAQRKPTGTICGWSSGPANSPSDRVMKLTATNASSPHIGKQTPYRTSRQSNEASTSTNAHWCGGRRSSGRDGFARLVRRLA